MRGDWSALNQPPRQLSRTATVGNLALKRVLLTAGGVDKHTLTNLVGLKNALADDFLAANGAEDRPTPEYVTDISQQFTALAENHDKAAKAAEMEEAREKVCRLRGLKYEPVSLPEQGLPE